MKKLLHSWVFFALSLSVSSVFAAANDPLPYQSSGKPLISETWETSCIDFKADAFVNGLVLERVQRTMTAFSKKFKQPIKGWNWDGGRLMSDTVDQEGSDRVRTLIPQGLKGTLLMQDGNNFRISVSFFRPELDGTNEAWLQFIEQPTTHLDSYGRSIENSNRTCSFTAIMTVTIQDNNGIENGGFYAGCYFLFGANAGQKLQENASNVGGNLNCSPLR